MTRPKIEWSDIQLRAIMNALAALDRDFPLDNDRFLDALIDEVRLLTGRLYGATTYSRLLRDVAPQVGVSRNPSSQTLQKAIGRAQSLAPTPAAGNAEAAPVVDVLAWRRALEPVVREALVPLHALLAQRGAQATLHMDGPESDSAAQRLQLAEASLADAHARVRRLEEENARLRREAAQAEARATVAETRIAGLLEDLHRTIAASASGAGALAKAAGQLAGTERFLKSQNDAVRLQASAEADALRRQVTQLRERVDHLLLDNEQYRRTLSTRQPGYR